MTVQQSQAQVINTGSLFISTDEIVMINGDFIQDDSTQRTINQGTLLISGDLHFVQGVIDETGGTLHGGWLRAAETPIERPDFHTIFLSTAQSINPSAILDGGDVDSVIDGPVRRVGGGDFVFPTGDIQGGETYRGLVGLAADQTASDVDAHYFWRNGQLDFGPQQENLLVAVSDREYWRVWADSLIDISPIYEASSRIDLLLQSTPGATLDNLTLAGWDGDRWVDLDGQAGSLSTSASGSVTARLLEPRTYLALTFALRLSGEEDTDNDSVPNHKEWDSNNDGQGPDDSDNDGVPDYLDPDDDGDGIPTRDEDWDQSGTPCDDDRDGDGRPDYLDPEAGAIIQLWVTKSANQTRFSTGDVVRWTLSVENRSNTAVSATLLDILPVGLAVDPSRLNLRTGGQLGAPSDTDATPVRHPGMSADDLSAVIHWPNLLLEPGETREVDFSTLATIGLDVGTHRNLAFAVANYGTTQVFSNLAALPFELRQDQQLGCTTVIGRVFKDDNSNGLPDPGEPGIAAARLGEHSGLLIKTDEHGRFHLPCELVPNGAGRNLVLKLDERTLPAGYKMTSENPRVVRVTRGKIAKANFGARLSREVMLNIGDCTFFDGKTGSRFHPSWPSTLASLMQVLDQGPSRLIIDYSSAAGLSDEALRARLTRAETDVRTLWKSNPRRYDLTISLRSKRLIGAEKRPCQRFPAGDNRFVLPDKRQTPQTQASRWSPGGIKPQ